MTSSDVTYRLDDVMSVAEVVYNSATEWTGRSSATSYGVHERPAAGAGEGIPQQEVPVSDGAIAAGTRPPTHRGRQNTRYHWPLP